MLFQLRHIAFQTPTAQNATEDLGVQRLYTAAQNAREGGEFLYRRHWDVEPLDERPCATRAVQMHTEPVQFLHDRLQAVLVEYRDQCAFDALCRCRHTRLRLRKFTSEPRVQKVAIQRLFSSVTNILGIFSATGTLRSCSWAMR